MACFGGLKSCLSSWKSAGSRLAHQPVGLPSIERAALALRSLQSHFGGGW